MKIFIVVTPDQQNAALVSLKSEKHIQSHPFIYPDDVQLLLCYHYPAVQFDDLPEALKRIDIFPFSNDFRNNWYQVNPTT
jgi:hypothetical protein